MELACKVNIYGIVKKDKWSFVKAAEVLGTYEMLFNVVNAILIGTGYAPYGIKGTNPYFKLALGLTGQGITGQGVTDARHTELYYDLQTYNFDYNAYKDAAKTYFTNLLSTHGFNYNWIWNKVIDFAGSLDNQYGFADGGIRQCSSCGCWILEHDWSAGLFYFHCVFFYIRHPEENHCER